MSVIEKRGKPSGLSTRWGISAKNMVEGAGTLCQIIHSEPVQGTQHKTVTGSLRSDWRKVGNDFRTVYAREMATRADSMQATVISGVSDAVITGRSGRIYHLDIKEGGRHSRTVTVRSMGKTLVKAEGRCQAKGNRSIVINSATRSRPKS